MQTLQHGQKTSCFMDILIMCFYSVKNFHAEGLRRTVYLSSFLFGTQYA